LRADAETRRLWPSELFVPPTDGHRA
jgi:hypothetical protein